MCVGIDAAGCSSSHANGSDTQNRITAAIADAAELAGAGAAHGADAVGCSHGFAFSSGDSSTVRTGTERDTQHVKGNPEAVKEL